MPAPSAYITASDLRAALAPGTFLQIFDDANTGSVADTDPGVELVIERAHAEVISYLPRVYGLAVITDPTQLPQAIPVLLKSAELDFAVAIALDRHPEFGKTYGDQERDARWKRAEGKMDRVASSLQIIVDNAPPPKPVTGGGVITDPDPRRTIVASPDGTQNRGDF